MSAFSSARRRFGKSRSSAAPASSFSMDRRARRRRGRLPRAADRGGRRRNGGRARLGASRSLRSHARRPLPQPRDDARHRRRGVARAIGHRGDLGGIARWDGTPRVVASHISLTSLTHFGRRRGRSRTKRELLLARLRRSRHNPRRWGFGADKPAAPLLPFPPLFPTPAPPRFLQRGGRARVPLAGARDRMPTLDLFLAAHQGRPRPADRQGRRHRRSARPRRRDLRLCVHQALFRSMVGRSARASGGKSLGAVRAMHGHIAAGKLTDIAFDDDEKRILVAAQDRRRRRMAQGDRRASTPASPKAGATCKRWPDPDSGLTRYTAEPQRNLARRSALPARRDLRGDQGRRGREARLRAAPRRA